MRCYGSVSFGSYELGLGSGFQGSSHPLGGSSYIDPLSDHDSEDRGPIKVTLAQGWAFQEIDGGKVSREIDGGKVSKVYMKSIFAPSLRVRLAVLPCILICVHPSLM